MIAEKPLHYRSSEYKLSSNQFKEFHRESTGRSIGAIVIVWAQITAIQLVMQYVVPPVYFWWTYVPTIFLLAGRQGALMQLIHEGSHNSLSKSKRLNDTLGKWFCALPIGVSYEGYKAGHLSHHAGVGTEIDPPSDSDKYRVTDFRKPMLYLLLLKDLVGISALLVFLDYGRNNTNAKPRNSSGEGGGIWLKSMVSFTQLCLVQLGLLLVLIQSRMFLGAEALVFANSVLLDNLIMYVLLWLVPATSPHMFLMRIRGIAEHGLMRQLGVDEGPRYTRGTDEGLFYTRSFLTPQTSYRFQPLIWLERLLIGSFNVNYHHEHHLYPRVPWYNLPKLHALVGNKVAERNPDVYARGYFSAAMRSVLSSQ